MGFFSRKKTPVICDVCDKEMAGKKHKLKDGVMCSECHERAGYRPSSLIHNNDRTFISETSVDELKNQVAEGTRFINKPLTLFYIQGLPSIKQSRFLFCDFVLDPSDLAITPYDLLETNSKENAQTFRIPYDRILAIDVLSQETINTKNKNVVGRGIAGGLLFGTAGAVLGGLSAMDQKTIINQVFSVAYTSKDGEIQNILCDVREDSVIAEQFSNYFDKKYNQNIVEFEQTEEGDTLL